jgi:Peptidyl-prolyl cis-trans isomerase (rotamase) - cyclophilin family
VKYGMVQGGDPLTKDPAKRALYGTGGQNMVKAEARAPKMTRGSVAAVLVPGKPDSAGSQFFIVLADQPALDNQYTVFAHVSDGIEVLQKISETPVDEKGAVTERIEIRHVTIRDTPAEPFVTETAAELGAYRAVLDSSAGPITIEFFVDKAPNTVRQFMRLAGAGVYNGMAFHRVAPGFVIQTGALSSRSAQLTARQQALVHNLAPEFNDTKHVRGIVSMARGDAPDSATTSFFICLAPSAPLDGVYTAFGRVVEESRPWRLSRQRRAPARRRIPASSSEACESRRRNRRGVRDSASAPNRVTRTATPTRYSTWMRSPGSRLWPITASGPMRATLIWPSGSSTSVK